MVVSGVDANHDVEIIDLSGRLTPIVTYVTILYNYLGNT